MRVSLVAALAVLASALAECDDGPKGPTVDGVNEARNTGRPNCNNRGEKLEDKDGIWVTSGQHRPSYSDQKVPAGNGKFADKNKYLEDRPPPPDVELAIVTNEKGTPRDVPVTRNVDGMPVEPCVYCDTKEAQRRRAAPPAPKGAVNDGLSVIPGVNSLTGTKKGKTGPGGQAHENPPWYIIVDPETRQQRLYSASKLDNTCPNSCSGLGKCVKGVCYCVKGYHCEDCSCKRCPSDCSNHGYCRLHTGECECKLGYFGDACTEFDLFKTTNCSNHGVGDGAGNCLCDPSWKGTICDKRTCETTCNQKNGVCSEGLCYCRTGWRGETCEIRTCPNQCNFMGTCDSDTGKCACIPGIYGDDCSRGEPMMPPEPSPCEKKTCGHGSCDFITGDCVCNTGWSGYDCRKSECTKTDATGGPIKDCGNAACKINMEGVAYCQCQPGWKKAVDAFKCEEVVPECKNNCTAKKSQGICSNDAKKCECKDGYAGEDCSQTKPRFCSDNCATTCVSLCVLNPAITPDPSKKIDAGEFGNNVHCLESCNGKCFVDCMAGATPTPASLAGASVAKAAHVGEDTDIQPAQISRSANGDKKMTFEAAGGDGAAALPNANQPKIALTGVSKDFLSQPKVDVAAPANMGAKVIEHHHSPGRLTPAEMTGSAPPKNVEE